MKYNQLRFLGLFLFVFTVSILFFSLNSAAAVCIDNDSDGYGNPADASCTYPELDCDDDNATIHPGALDSYDVPDTVDNDCDGEVDEDSIRELIKLLASDGAVDNYFGFSVSISNDTLVVGAYGDDDKGSNSGSAYIFYRNQGGTDNWGEVKKLTASDGAAGDIFGYSVSISNDTVVVAAPVSDFGSAYIFSRNQGGTDNWGEVKKLTASDGAVDDWFGYYVSISNDTVVVGACYECDYGDRDQSGAYIYYRNQGGNDNWGEVKKLTAREGTSGDQFGNSVSISGDTVVVGAYLDADNGSQSGSAYVFQFLDVKPDQFIFTDQVGVARNITIVSNTVNPSGFGHLLPITVEGGEYELNGSDVWQSNAGEVMEGDVVKVRHTSSPTNSTNTDTILTIGIGNISDTFTSTTLVGYNITLDGAGIGSGTITDTIVDATYDGNSLNGDVSEIVDAGTGPYVLQADTSGCGAIVSWSGDCDVIAENATKTATCTITPVDNDKTITTDFSILNSNTITVTQTTGGVIAPEGDVAVCGGHDQQFSITPDTGYHITDVLVDGGSVGLVSNYQFDYVTTDHTITALYEINSYTIDASISNSGGSISPSGQIPVNHGSSQIFSITPDAGSQIATLLVDGELIDLNTLVNNTYTIENVIEDNHWIQVTFLLIPAPTTISFDLSSLTILQNETVDVSGKLTRLPDLGIDLSGVEITLTMTESDGETTWAETTTTYDAAGHFRFNEVSGFTHKGVYTLQAEFVAAGALYGSLSQEKTLLVGSQAGYAVIIQGSLGGEDPEGLDSHNKTVNRVYQTMKGRGFIDDNIFYFNFDDTQEGVDGVPDKVDIEAVFTNMDASSLAARMNGSPAPLFIAMVDHGNRDIFYLGDDVITPTDLSGWLTTLESNLSVSALEEKQVIIIGSCYSGSFIPPLAAAGRIIVTSAAVDEESYKGPLEPDGIRSGEFFLEEYFKLLKRGASLKQAFVEATELTEQFTRQGGDSSNSNGGYFDTAMQHPLLEDDGVGSGSNDLSLAEGDGEVADTIFLGVGQTYDTNSADNPADILQVTETLYLDTNISSAQLWALANDDTQVLNAWYEIRDPNKVLTAKGGTVQLEVDLVKNFMALDESETPDRWEDTFGGFVESGMYEIFYFVRDIGDPLDETVPKAISPMKRSVIYKAKADNTPPPGFSLDSPTDSSEQKTVLIFDWEDSTDTDGLTYTLAIARDENLTDIVFQREEIVNSLTHVDQSAGLEDPSTYYWQVWAVDRFGALTPSTNGPFMFSTTNTNAFPGFIIGTVYNSLDFQPLSGVTISSDLGGTADSLDNGAYIIPSPAGTAEVSCLNYDGFEDAVVADVEITSGGTTTVNISMLPLGAESDTTPPVSSAEPKGDSYVGPTLIDVILTCNDVGAAGCADIFYTLDGSNPTAGSAVYTNPLAITETTTLRFFAKDLAGNSEDVNEEIYQFIAGKGDINVDGIVDLEDLIISLKVLSGGDMPNLLPDGADVNQNNQVDMTEAVYILQDLSGLR